MGRDHAAVLAVMLLTCLGACAEDVVDPEATGEGATTSTVRSPSASGPETSVHGSAGTSANASRKERGDRDSYFLGAYDQPSDGTTLIVDEVVMAKPGWIAVHSVVGGELGPVIGSSTKLPEGSTRSVQARLARPLVASIATVHLMVHLDTDGNATFDYPRADFPASSPSEDPITVPVRLQIG